MQHTWTPPRKVAEEEWLVGEEVEVRLEPQKGHLASEGALPRLAGTVKKDGLRCNIYGLGGPIPTLSIRDTMDEKGAGIFLYDPKVKQTGVRRLAHREVWRAYGGRDEDWPAT